MVRPHQSGQCVPKMLVPLCPDLLAPFLLDLGVGAHSGFVQPFAARSEADNTGAVVSRILFEEEVSESFEVAQEVVDPLLGNLHIGGHLAGATPIGAGPAEEGDVCRSDVGETGAAYSLVDTAADFVQPEPQQRPDRRGRKAGLPSQLQMISFGS